MHSVRFLQERYPRLAIGFLTTPESRATAELVAASADLEPEAVRMETVADDPSNTREVILSSNRLLAWLRGLGLPPGKIAVNPTGGRKWMSAALSLFGSYHGLLQVYVDVEYGSSGPSPSTMELVRLGDLLEQSQLLRLDAVQKLFNSGLFLHAALLAQEIAGQGETGSLVAGALADLALYLHDWDQFRYLDEEPSFVPVREAASRALAPIGADWRAFFERMESLQEVIQELHVSCRQPGPKRLFLLDLVANARRRFLSDHYGDALVRLMRLAEELAAVHLAEHGIDVWDLGQAAEREDLPESVRELLRKRAAENRASLFYYERIKILSKLKHPFGKLAYKGLPEGFREVWDLRNRSAFIHGYEWVEPKVVGEALDWFVGYVEDLTGRSVAELEVPEM
ncbi:MAG: hypothetical protein WHU10_13525, partial [Fimbriimonadales bacterium]